MEFLGLVCSVDTSQIQTCLMVVLNVPLRTMCVCRPCVWYRCKDKDQYWSWILLFWSVQAFDLSGKVDPKFGAYLHIGCVLIACKDYEIVLITSDGLPDVSIHIFLILRLFALYEKLIQFLVIIPAVSRCMKTYLIVGNSSIYKDNDFVIWGKIWTNLKVVLNVPEMTICVQNLFLMLMQRESAILGMLTTYPDCPSTFSSLIRWFQVGADFHGDWINSARKDYFILYLVSAGFSQESICYFFYYLHSGFVWTVQELAPVVSIIVNSSRHSWWMF